MTTPDSPIALRRHLHAHPELSSHEHQTALTLAAFHQQFNPDQLLTELGTTGVAAVYDFGTHEGRTSPTVLVRSELDALPITEASNAPHASTNPGVMHACGHDGHAAIVASLAARFRNNPPPIGRLVLLHQPAEETGAGMRAVLDDPRWPQIEPDVCIALHNLPGEPLGAVVVAEPIFSCASTGITFHLTGLPGHCCSPQFANNPLHAMAPIISALLNVSSDVDPAETAQVVLTHLNVGQDAVFGTSPAAAQLNATLRTITDEGLAELVRLSRQLVELHAAQAGLKLTTQLRETFLAARCDPAMVNLVRTAAHATGAQLIERGGADGGGGGGGPFRWSEDFGLLTTKCPGVLFGLGSGTHQPPLHHPTFDFPDQLIEPGADLLEHIARAALHR